MSAETQHRSSTGYNVVLPQPVSDRSIIDSVTGFITEVVPQVSTTSSGGENKDVITWARFESADVNDPSLFHDHINEEQSTNPPLLLILGYGSGVQVWCVKANGEASELLSWRRGVVRTLRVLPTPCSELEDVFAHKRPLVALCDSTGPGPQFCSLSFISLKIGDQVKIIKYKNPISDIVCSRRVVIVSFPEKLAILDAGSLEEKRAVTTCYPAPGPNPNPLALGSRWLAYSERKISPTQLSAGGAELYSTQSVTATVLHAAKSLGKGLRDFGETVASSLAGQRCTSQSDNAVLDLHPGVVTILDVQSSKYYSRENNENQENDCTDVIAHFVAHPDPIVALSFDPSGLLLLTADKRGHDFHLFRIHPHPCGSANAAIHHLYVLHRGDTTARVQDIAWSCDARWVAVSTLRGTTHVFAVTTYGGPIAVRTHATVHVVNRQSRFHRSAGLLADGRNSPETVTWNPSIAVNNPRLPPFPHPTTLGSLAQIRVPGIVTAQPRNENSNRQANRQASLEDSGGVPLRVSACFSPPRGWLLQTSKASQKLQKKVVDSLFVISCQGSLIEYNLKPHHANGIPKEKVCDDTPIELDVEPKVQWNLLHPPHISELQLPLSPNNVLLAQCTLNLSIYDQNRYNDDDEHWLSQVEIVTHAGPHRRLWMGPQFVFKTYSGPESEAVEVGATSGSRLVRSNPVNIPLGSSSRPVVPVLIESGSSSSFEQSPRMNPSNSDDSDSSVGPADSQLAESLADAMRENPSSTNKANVDFISL